MSSTNTELTLFHRLHAVCDQVNADKAFHEQAGHKWHLDSGKLQTFLMDNNLSVQIAESNPDTPSNQNSSLKYDPIGIERAESEIKADPSLSLFECEVTVTWMNGPFTEAEPMTVFVASSDAGQALELAEQYACQHFNNPRAKIVAQDVELIQSP